MADKGRFWNVSVCVFAAAVLFYGLARARHEFRWSGWALGDAQNLNAALHFADEGFRNHYFLTYYHSGFLGESYGNESQAGYYTRYPPLSAVWNGFLIKFFSATRTCLKSASVVLSCLALLFAYGSLSFFFTRRAAFFATAAIGGSVGFLQFMDSVSLYTYSEFFRFSGIFFFLLSEKNKAKPSVFYVSAILAWTITFLESLNSLDYIFFFQAFFLAYFFLSGEGFPFKKIAFYVLAPAAGCALHFTQDVLALHPYGFSAADAFLKAFPDKIAPFHKGIFHVFSFITYFARTMEGHFVNTNFGFGFGVLYLMTASIFLISAGRIPAPALIRPPFTLGRTFALFVIPSVSWWVIFPNQSASFFNSAMHAFPVVGLAFGLAMDTAIAAVQKPDSGLPLKTGAVLLLIGSAWSPVLFTGKYLKEYPNLLDPSQKIMQSGAFHGLDRARLENLTRLMRPVKDATRYGDIILCPRIFYNEHHFYEFYAQRRMEWFGKELAWYPREEKENLDTFKLKLEEMKKYREEGAAIYKIFNPRLKIYGLSRASENPEIHQFLSKNFKNRDLGEGWMLFDVESPLKPERTRR